VTWLLLDVGGVLEVVDDASWPGEWAARSAGRVGITSADFAERLADPALPDLMRTHGEADEYWRRFGAMVGASDDDLAAIRADFWDAYCGAPNERLLTELRRLRGSVGLAILSNSADGAREEEERRFGFSGLFDPICYSHELGVAKPEPAAFAHVLRLMGAEAGEVLFIDNWAPNIDAARAIGLPAHLHRDDEETLAVIRAAVGRI